ncbi:MAG: protein-glutamate O-methyltransferase CheR [Novosphingobium sp.]|uniref:CheR family methyltransferase n=1 Tax=Novosphingobium sp. TaxID=1874826 RepID=UPI0030182284
MSTAVAAPETLPGISPGVYSAEDFAAVSEIAHREAGIVLAEGKAMLVYSRLAPLVRDSGCATFGSYILRLREDAAERGRAIMALTTNHTFFYREAHHFAHFADHVRPGMIARLGRGEKARLWSAGCSSGEETWSLLMTLLGPDRIAGERISRGDLRLLASDLAEHALHKAEAARYRAEELKAVPEPLTRAWTVPSGNDLEIAPPVRALARFRTLNLLGRWPMQGKFDVIFCRNVMIYFDNPTKERLVARFAEALVPGGWLYVGHSERVTGPALDLLASAGPTIYRRSEA